jgi:hypothetical protein
VFKWGHLSPTLAREKKQSQVGRERGTWEGKLMVDGAGGVRRRGEPDLVLGEGKGQKPWGPAERMETGNLRKQEVDGTLQNAPESWEVRDSQDLNWRTLNKMPHSGERELMKPTSSRKTEHQVRDGVAIPQTQFWPIIGPVWRNYKDGNGEELEEKKVQQQAESGVLTIMWWEEFLLWACLFGVL